MMSLSYIKNCSEKSEENFKTWLEERNFTLNSTQIKYSDKSLFNSVIYVFLDVEEKTITNLESVVKKTIAYNNMSPYADLSKDNLFSKWMNIYFCSDFCKNQFLYKAFIKSFSLLLDYSLFNGKKLTIEPTIQNIVYIRNLLDTRDTNYNYHIYPFKSQITEYGICWKSLSQFFYKYYKEIFALDKDKQYNLDPDFDKTSYSFEKTKQYISSLKKKG